MEKHQKELLPFIVVLGIAQDGGLPHCGCQKSCCHNSWEKLSGRQNAASLAVIDPQTKQRWLIDATPDFKFQLAFLDRIFPVRDLPPGLEGIFLTHGHAGHYTGFLNLEKAVLEAKNVPVFAMPKMRKFLAGNRPWKDLIGEKNIKLERLEDKQKVILNSRISLEPFLVPHRSEYSETVGFWINGPRKKVLFIPDIDKWELSEGCVEDKIFLSDLALLDGTFFSLDELPHRDISQVPHPFVVESAKRFGKLPMEEIRKINFIHMNHTNPILSIKSKERRWLQDQGFCLARQGQFISI